MPCRVVLDTNIVLSALLFNAGRLVWMRQAWQRHKIRPLMCRASVNELLRVLAYPKFRLTETEQEDLLADFLPYAEVVSLPDPWPDVPLCRDEHDQVFLVLARVGEADFLVTGDDDILAMSEHFPGLILTADRFRELQKSGK